MSSALIRTGIDAWVQSNLPTTNHGASKQINVEATGGSPQRICYGYIYFTNPAPRNATILSATLKLYTYGAFGSSVTVSVQRVGAKWSASSLTYNNRPAGTGASVSKTATTTTSDAEWAFDVTALLQTITDGSPNYGFVISTTSTTLRQFNSLKAGDFRPVLDVEWSLAPDAPSALSPGGGSTITGSAPVLLFNFHDVAGLNAMQALQVQINPTNDFTAPAFDSGTILSSDPQLDLSTTAYAGLASGGTAWWRVRVQDDAGLWSDWSDPTSFSRVSRGTLTINSPSAGVVNDATQDILWTLTGATQTAWRVIVYDDSNPTFPLVDTGRKTGTDTSYTLPKGVVTSESTTYRLVVRTWDDVTRVSSPNDPTFTEAVETFVFQEDPTPAPVTSFTAVQAPNGLPHVYLNWQRSTAPDFYAIWRDGTLVDTDLDPADLLTSGTSYFYADLTANPHETHTYVVRCKVNGKLGPGPTATVQFDVPEVWLSDLDTDVLCPIIPTTSDQVTFDMPETSAVYRPVNGGAPIRVVQGRFGLEGTIQGRITTRAGRTAQTWRDNLLWMKVRPEKTYRLSVGGYNLPVKIGNVVISPLANGNPDDRQASFDFWSIAGPTVT